MIPGVLELERTILESACSVFASFLRGLLEFIHMGNINVVDWAGRATRALTRLNTIESQTCVDLYPSSHRVFHRILHMCEL